MPTTSYNTGTTSVAANGTTVTGQGTQFVAAGLREGDMFWAAGLSVRIASVNSPTSLTLAYPWPGTVRTAAAYEVLLIDDGVRALAAASQIVSLLDNGNLLALSDLASSANKLPYFTGAGAAALADITAMARSLLALTGTAGRIPVATGLNTMAMRDIVGTVGQSSGIPTGALMQVIENGNGRAVRFADGTQICSGTITDFTTTTVAYGNMFGSAEVNFDFPAAFVNTPQMSGGARSSAPRWVNMRPISTTQGTGQVFSPTSSAGLVIVDFIAIGRWF